MRRQIERYGYWTENEVRRILYTAKSVSGVARRRKVGGGHKLFPEKMKSKKKKKKKTPKKKMSQRRKSAGGFIKNDWELLGLCLICIKIVLKGGRYGGPPPENFYRIGYKIRHF